MLRGYTPLTVVPELQRLRQEEQGLQVILQPLLLLPFECEMPPTGSCLYSWLPVGGAIFGRPWNFRKWSLAGCSAIQVWVWSLLFLKLTPLSTSQVPHLCDCADLLPTSAGDWLCIHCGRDHTVGQRDPWGLLQPLPRASVCQAQGEQRPSRHRPPWH